MFEKVILRRSDSGPALSAGELAEAMLFYQNIHIVIDYGSLVGLVKAIGADSLLAVLRRQGISAVYYDEILGTMTNTIGQVDYHKFVGISFAGKDPNPKRLSKREKLEHALERAGLNGRDGKIFAEAFLKLVPIRNYGDTELVPGGVYKAALADLAESDFVKEAMLRVLTKTDGAAPVRNDFRFEVLQSGEEFVVRTNLDLSAMNSVRARLKLAPVNMAHLVLQILEARADATLASHYGGEFYTSELTSEIIRLRYAEILMRMQINSSQLAQFYEIVIAGCPSIREAVNSSVLEFKEFIKLLDGSQKFREWIRGVNPDGKLVEEYFRAVTSEDWTSKLPTRGLRYAIGTALGAVLSPVAGAAVSAVDSFLLDKIIGGWRPNHFIDKKLKPLLGEK